MRKLIEASHAVAISAKMCRPAVIPVYPITPQTHIVEHLSDFVNNGGMNAEMIHSESEHSALSSAIGAQATGVRTFTATASQGLALMHEILFVASGLRVGPMPCCLWGDVRCRVNKPALAICSPSRRRHRLASSFHFQRPYARYSPPTGSTALALSESCVCSGRCLNLRRFRHPTGT